MWRLLHIVSLSTIRYHRKISQVWKFTNNRLEKFPFKRGKNFVISNYDNYCTPVNLWIQYWLVVEEKLTVCQNLQKIKDKMTDWLVLGSETAIRFFQKGDLIGLLFSLPCNYPSLWFCDNARFEKVLISFRILNPFSDPIKFCDRKSPCKTRKTVKLWYTQSRKVTEWKTKKTKNLVEAETIPDIYSYKNNVYNKNGPNGPFQKSQQQQTNKLSLQDQSSIIMFKTLNAFKSKGYFSWI